MDEYNGSTGDGCQSALEFTKYVTRWLFTNQEDRLFECELFDASLDDAGLELDDTSLRGTLVDTYCGRKVGSRLTISMAPQKESLWIKLS